MLTKARLFEREWVLLLIVGITLVMCTESWGQQPKIPMKPKVVTINEKSEDTNQIFVAERCFRVPPGTPILDRRGKNLTLKQLVVPCRAQVDYTLSSTREYVVEKIQLK